ncbi:MAG: 5-oxoprolinase subunit PxpA [Phaeospirillum sp.]|nr:5-oxoprolinase subunit PxpA [Phaeospirillum sp.]
MSRRVNLNADLGEGCGDDQAMLDLVASANIACGFHAGDAMEMTRTVRAALARGVSLGAHPSYPDREGFGRRPMDLSAAEIEAVTAYQIGALQGIAAANGGRLGHVKPHGALSNRAAVELEAALAIARAIRGVDAGLIFLAPSGSAMVEAGRMLGLRVAQEVFADRNYDDDGNLAPRSHPQALIRGLEEAAAHALRMVRRGVIRTLSGRELPCVADSICIHGDDPHAVVLARHLRLTLDDSDIEVVSLI